MADSLAFRSLDIAAVARLTGLSSRTLRHYESLGLVKPLRSASGRRHYGPAELERLHQIQALKRIGLKLADIGKLGGKAPINFAMLVKAQLASISEQADQLADLHSLLTSINDRLQRNETIDVPTFCALIRHGDQMNREQDAGWAALVRDYMSARAEADFAETQSLIPADFNQADYSAQWLALGQRIKAAMPLDPAGTAALDFVRQWFRLLAPFSAIATPAMWDGTRAMYDDVDHWRGRMADDPGFDGEVWRFISTATEMAMARGDDIGPLPHWMMPIHGGTSQ